MSDIGGVGVAWEVCLVSNTYEVYIECYDIGLLQNTVDAWREFLGKVDSEGRELSESEVEAFEESQVSMERVRVLRRSDGYTLLDIY